jgi:hypothetical protein
MDLGNDTSAFPGERMIFMDSAMQNQLMRAWIALQKSPHDSEDYHRLFWAHEKIWELGQDSPRECLSVILAILQHDPSDKIVENLAAGPLEDLLSAHGDELIDEIELQAKRNDNFRRLLGGVWQNAISDDVWERLKAVAGSRW